MLSSFSRIHSKHLIRTSTRSQRCFASTLELAKGLVAGDRRNLARAITLVESQRADDGKRADLLLDEALSLRKSLGTKKCIRMGIAGPPGAGKSTFIEALGTDLISKGMNVAVISVDPSSVRSGGSILGDKTRMTELSRNANAFVRACPTRGVLGGLSAHTNSVVLLCQAAGYDVIIVETVGLGQSEVEIEQTVDVLLLLLPPANGDELQGSKKGILESADLIGVNKADGDLLKDAKRTAADYKNASHFNRPKYPFWVPPVVLCSAKDGTGMEKLWKKVEGYLSELDMRGLLMEKRKSQGRYWMMKHLERQLTDRALRDESVQREAGSLEKDLANGVLGPRLAAVKLIDSFVQSIKSS